MTPSPSSTADELIAHLKTLRNEENIAGMARFGIVTDHALGISTPDLRAIARQAKRNHARALALWQSGIREARLLAAFTDELDKVTADQARTYAATFDSWEMVDSWADIFASAGLGDQLIPEFATDEREFVRRTGFTMIAWTAVHLKKLPDSIFLDHLRLIETHARDPRNFVKKAVNWALRQIGKRNPTCHAAALTLAQSLAASDDRTARWNGRDAVKELTGDVVARRLKRVAATK
jgi:3-methyladenine DNA glycosylase AlkD